MGQKSKTPLKAVILVGGEGTRLRPLTYYVPKAMVPILNRPFLEHIIAYLNKYGIEDIIFTIGYLPETIQEYFGDGSNRGVKLTYTVEDSPLGTAGAVKNAEQYLDSTFTVLNGDIFTDIDIADMLAFHRHKRAKVTIALSWVDNPGAFGVIETESDGRVKHFIEKPPPDKVTTNWINAGIYIIEPEVLRHIPAHSPYMFEKGLFPLLLQLNEPVYGYPTRGYWLDMGTLEKYLRLNHDLLLPKTSSALIGDLNGKGVNCDRGVFLHPSAKISGPVVIGSNCKISQRAHIKGPTVIGPDCSIEDDASIEATILWNGVNIGAGANLKRCIVASNAGVESNEQLADSTITPDDVRLTQIV